MKYFTHRIIVASLLCGIMTVPATVMAQPSKSLSFLSKKNNCTAYSFNYPSISASGDSTILSSALFAWTPSDRVDTDSIESLHIYCHITLGADRERPSTTTSASTEQTLLMSLPGREYKAYGSAEAANYVSRCIIIAPDYEGYGVSKDVPHPYLSEQVTAMQVADAVKYGLELYRAAAADSANLLSIKSDWRTFAIGFSQGGAVALATHKYIEQTGLDNMLHFKGSMCCDGPYDLVSTIRYYYEDNGDSYGITTAHTKGKVTMPVVMPLILKGLYLTHPELKSYTIEDFLSQQLIDTGVLDWIDSKQYSTDQIGSKWKQQLTNGINENGKSYTPEQMAGLFSIVNNAVWGNVEKMFTPAVNSYLSQQANFNSVPSQAANAQETLHRALVDNSLTTGWEPKHRILFFHSKGDMVVPYGNYLSFRDAHKEGEGNLYKLDDTFSTADHVTAGTTFCISMALSKTYSSYFNWLSQDITTTEALSVQPEKKTTPDVWYDLLGHQLEGMPTQKGIYIYNNIKVVIP